jgi:hypothetical protein
VDAGDALPEQMISYDLMSAYVGVAALPSIVATYAQLLPPCFIHSLCF